MEFSRLLFIFEKILFFTLELIIFVLEIIFMNSIFGIEYLLNLTLNKIANKLVDRKQNKFFLNSFV